MIEFCRRFDPDDPVIDYQGIRISRAVFGQRVESQARAFTEAGLVAGDRVLLLLPNSPELLVAYYACFMRGLVAVPVNIRMAQVEIQRISGRCAPSLCLAFPPAFALATEVCERVARPAQTRADSPPSTSGDWPDDHPAALFFTSGSTGEPKGVIYTHGILRHCSRMYRHSYRLTSADRSVIAHCLAHNFMLTQVAIPVLDAGGSIEIIDFGIPGQAVDALAGGVTYLKLIPWFAHAVFALCLERGLRFDRVRLCLAGGDRVSQRVFDMGRAVLGIGISQNIGMTETNTYAADLASGANSAEGSCGRALPGARIEIRDSRDRVLGPGQSGQIFVSSPCAMQSYWNDEAATQETLRDGWIATGDAGHFDEAGNLWFDFRIKQMIIRDGDNIYPAEVERAVSGYPGIDKVLVFGLEDPVHGESVAAALTTVDGIKPDFDRLVSFLAPLLSPGKIPGRWIHLDDFPHTHNGKIDLATLKRLLESAS